MNIENLRAVQAQIRAHPERLNMAEFAPKNDASQLIHNCGTRGCIAGWAAAMAGHKAPNLDEGSAYDKALENQRALVQAAADFLGISTGPLEFRQEMGIPSNNEVVLQLFFAEDFLPGGDLELYSADDAIAAIEAVITTGKPTWPTFSDIGAF